VEFVEPGGTEPSPQAASVLLEQTRARGLLVGKGGLHNNVIRLAPPMTLTTEEAEEALAILEESVARAHEERSK
jgi:4-aminobutyrate aminotransferase